MLKNKKKPILNLIKGYLDEDIIVTLDEDIEELISKNTYLEFDTKSMTIQKPIDYKGIELDKKPILFFSKAQRSIRLSPSIITKEIKGRVVTPVSFKIDTNVNISKIVFNNKTLKYTQNENIYFTKKRVLKDKSKIYSLILKGDSFQEVYECQYDENNQFSCNKKEKEEMK